jgi:hypothetical protein
MPLPLLNIQRLGKRLAVGPFCNSKLLPTGSVPSLSLQASKEAIAWPL